MTSLLRIPDFEFRVKLSRSNLRFEIASYNKNTVLHPNLSLPALSGQTGKESRDLGLM